MTFAYSSNCIFHGTSPIRCFMNTGYLGNPGFFLAIESLTLVLTPSVAFDGSSWWIIILVFASMDDVFEEFFNHTTVDFHCKSITESLSSQCNIASFGSLGNQKNGFRSHSPIFWACLCEQYTHDDFACLFLWFKLELLYSGLIQKRWTVPWISWGI